MGNRVWKDTNGNGIQDAGEPGIAGVKVILYNAAGTNPIATATTDANGDYYFSNDTTRSSTSSAIYALPLTAGSTYQIQIQNATGANQQTALAGLTPTTPFNDSTANGAARDSNGVLNSTTDFIEATASANTVTLGTAGQDDHTLDAGFEPLLSLGNFVWNDTNNDGSFDASEVGLPGVTVALLDGNGNPILVAGNPVTTTTDSAGHYEFDNLLPGTYEVQITPPAGYISSTGTNGSPAGPFEPGSATFTDATNNTDHGTQTSATTITSAPVTLSAPGSNPDTGPTGVGNANFNVDFGVFQPLSLGDTVWVDANNDGTLDNGETGLNGVTVVLFSGATPVATTTTAGNGNYLFTDLIPGTYTVQITPPAGYVSSTGTNGSPTGPYEPATGVGFTDPTNSTDHGTTAGATITSAAVTLAAPGTAGNPDPGTGGANTANLNVDFGVYQPLSLGDTVWVDANNDGTLDNGETGLNGVTVVLFSGATPVATTTTAGNGQYLFTDLIPGTYTVQITPPAGYVSSTGTNGSPTGPFEPGVGTFTDATNSTDHGTQTTPTTITSAAVTLTAPGTAGNPDPGTGGANTANLNVDFGVFQPLSLGDTVWVDANNDGTLDNGETGLNGVTVVLFSGATPVATTTTAGNGNYLFTDLIPGTYTVQITPPAGYVSSTGTNGSPTGPYEPATGVGFTDPTNSTDHGTTAGATITSAAVTLAAPGTAGNPDPGTGGANTANLNVDFGVFLPLSVGDTVWADADNDGTLDNGEAGIPGVTVVLDMNGSPVATTTTNAQGGYLFTDLIPGQYQVSIPAANFAPGGPLAGQISSTGTNGSPTGPFEPSPLGSGSDGQDHGTTQPGGAVTGAVVTLALGTEPTGEAPTPGGIPNPATDADSDTTQDFGFFTPLSLGDTVWADANNDGTLDGTETGLNGVTVVLFSGATPIATTTTAGNGNYLFTDLIPGTYTVQITPPAGYISSTGTNGSPTGPYEPATGVGFTDPTNSTDHGTQTTPTTSTSGSVTLSAPGTNPDTAGDANLNVDFGVFQPLSLGDTVWVDANNDGTLDNGETGLPGVTVTLLDGNGNPILDQNNSPITTTTNASGQYLFTDLVPGSYEVRITPPAGYVSSTGTNGSASGPYEPGSTDFSDAGNNTDHGTQTTPTTITSGVVTLVAPGTNPDTAGDANLNVDFGVFQPLSVGDTVWADANNDGTLDNGEAGIPGVTVVLDTNGSPVATTTTNAQGGYLFTDLIPGQYQVSIPAANFAPGGPLAGQINSTGTNGSPTGPFEPSPLGSGSDGQDHGTTQPGGAVTGPVVTLALGTEPTGEAPTPGGIPNPATDADSDTTQDFGFFTPLSLGDTVWADANNDGTLDNSETGLNGVTVVLFSGATPVATTTTAGNGNYLFTDLIPGTYTVQITPPAGYISSTGTNGSPTGPYEPATGVGFTDPTNSTDHGTTTGATIASGPVTLAAPGNAGNPDPGAGGANTANLNVDFGVFQPLSLGDTVWVDANNDGLLDNSEAGLPGVTVALLDGNGNPIVVAGNPLTTTTDASGHYLFTDLVPGSYEVRITPPAGYVSSTGTNGSPTGPFEPGVATFTDATNNTDHGTQTTPTTITSGVVTLAASGTAGNPDPGTGGANTANLNVDFGVFQPLSLGDTVWDDANNDGTLDGTEAGIPNVTVTLLSNGNPIATTTTDGTGHYLFTDLIPGTYTVQVTPPTGYASSTGTNGSPTGPYEPGSTNYTDAGNNTDHGTQTGAVVTSQPVTLTTPGTNPDAGAGGVGSANTNGDFGLFQPLSIGNLVWNDANNDGMVDNGEAGIPGVVVSLLNASNAVVASTTTNSQGSYLFTDLIPGTYHVQIDASNFAAGGALAGQISSTGTNGSPTGPYEPTSLASGSNNQDHGTTSGTLGSGGVVLGNPIVLGIGTAPTGEGSTPGITDPATDANSDTTQDFGFFTPLSVGNLVWNDANNDGTVDNGELGLANVTVVLLDSNGQPVATTTTDGSGNYQFVDLIPGTYQVRVTPPAGYTSSSGTNASVSGPFEPGSTNFTNAGNNTDHGTVTGTTVTSPAFSLSLPGSNPDAGPGGAGTANTNVDFGLYQPLSLGNFVFGDTNNDGVLDGAESGIGGITVTLLDGTGHPILVGGNPVTTTTDASGHYQFNNLVPGTYQVQITPPPGYSSSTGTSGSPTGPYEPGSTNYTDAGNNTDHGTANGATIISQPVTLTAAGTNPDAGPSGTGDANLNVDFGIHQSLSLGNLVFDDTNNDGRLDGNETGIPNVTVTLLDGNGQPVLDSSHNPITTTTDANGFYQFNNLAPGTYQVQITPPAGYISSSGTNGSLTGPFEPGSTNFTDAGNNTDHGTTTGTTVTSPTVTLNPPGGNPDNAGNGNLNVDFGLYQPLSLGNFVFNDANNDGKMDNGEAGVPGVPVVLLDATGDPVATTTTDAAGHYQFDDLAPGTYRVQITPPPDSSPVAGPTAARPGRSSPGRPTTPTPATTPTTGPPPGRPLLASRSP
nr:SdrD B-like domain-containing protein [Fimbriiglobus ruber]